MNVLINIKFKRNNVVEDRMLISFVFKVQSVHKNRKMS